MDFFFLQAPHIEFSERHKKLLAPDADYSLAKIVAEESTHPPNVLIYGYVGAPNNSKILNFVHELAWEKASH